MLTCTRQTDTDDLRALIQRAREDVEAKMQAWGMADPEYEAVAWHELQAAVARLNALLAEAKREHARAEFAEVALAVGEFAQREGAEV